MTATYAMTKLIGRALDEPPSTLQDAARQEQNALWDDLGEAIKHAINGHWSMQCDWLVERIAVFAVLTQHITPLDDIASTFPPALYDDIIEALRARF